MGPLARRVLLLDGNANDRDLAFELLAAGLSGVLVECAENTEELTHLLGTEDFDLVVAERSLAARAGKQLSQKGMTCPLIVLCTPHARHSVREALALDAFCVLPKDSAGYLQLAPMARRAMERGVAPLAPESGLVDRLPVGVFSMDAEGRIRRSNRGAAEALGFSEPSDAIGQALVDMLDSHSAQRRLLALLEGGQQDLDLEASLRRSDGQNWWARLRLWRSGDGQEAYEGTLENISDYKKTEAELGRQAAELGRSNAELEQFAYVVSHDLQEPLSLIRRYAELLGESKPLAGNPEASEHLDRVLQSSLRMQSMMDAILEYSRIETRGTPFKPLDLNEVLDTAVAHLAESIEKNGAEIKYRELPTLKADREQMLQLFQNLIANAIKFRAHRRKPRVSVSAVEQKEHWRFTVQDNGIGIDPEQRDRIFGMFQRLHSDDEYAGTGIGLAICRGIVRRHGGDIWVDSVPGEGSSFHLTISKTL